MKNGKIWTRELSDWHRSFKKKQLRQGYRFFECEFCEYSWKEKSRDAKSPSGSTCPECGEESHPIGHEIDGMIPVDEYGNLI